MSDTFTQLCNKGYSKQVYIVTAIYLYFVLRVISSVNFIARFSSSQKNVENFSKILSLLAETEL